MPVTKHSFLVTDAQEVPSRLAEAFHIASTGRPGPVLVDVTKDAQTGQMDFVWPPPMDIPGYRTPGRPSRKQIKAAAEAIAQSNAPVIYLGGGAVRGDATGEVMRLIHLTDAAVGALQRADLLITLGARFYDRVTGQLDTFAPRAKVIHVDIDAAEISKNRKSDIPVVGDLNEVLAGLNAELPEVLPPDYKEDLYGWWRYLNRLRDSYPLGYVEPNDGMLAPQYVLGRLSELSGPDAIYSTGVGQHQMWASQFLGLEKPRHFISSSGLGTMGYALPAGIGAKVAKPDETVWVIDGDGSFQMTLQELATAVTNDIPIKIALINNTVLGMVRQWQNLFYNERYSHTKLNDQGEGQVPDFVALANAYSVPARRVTKADEVDEAIKWALTINDRPVLIDFRVSKDAMVWPMVAAGVSNDDIRYARGMAPVWDEVE